jgi:ABC-2 type transport system ATP-binding protein
MSETREGRQEVLVLERATVRYGKTLAADAVSLGVPEGAVYALLGRNGAGKTSLIRVLLGQLKPREGRALLFGEDVWRRRARLMARVGVVPETPDAPPDLTSRQLLAFSSRLYPVYDLPGALSRLERFGVSSDVPFEGLSKGQKGQVMLALALAHKPDLLVLDDPTLGLDAVARKALFEELIADLADRGATVFLSSHDLTGVESIADRVGLLSSGRLLLHEPLEDLKARFRKLFFRREGDSSASALEALERMAPVTVRRGPFGEEAVVSRFGEAAFASFAACPGILGAEAEAMGLEAIFLALAGEEGGAS